MVEGSLGSGGLVRSFDWCCGARRRRGDGVRPETAGTEVEMTEDGGRYRCTKGRLAFLSKYVSIHGLGHFLLREVVKKAFVPVVVVIFLFAAVISAAVVVAVSIIMMLPLIGDFISTIFVINLAIELSSVLRQTIVLTLLRQTRKN